MYKGFRQEFTLGHKNDEMRICIRYFKILWGNIFKKRFQQDIFNNLFIESLDLFFD
jgi:hypothetical protein